MELIAPSFHFSPTDFQQGLDKLKSWNLTPTFPKDIQKPHFFFSHTDETRLKRLCHALKSTHNQGVWSIRGGAGSSRLMMDFLDWLKKHRNAKKKQIPKVVVGYSDFTLILNLLYQEWGWVTFHGPLIAGRSFHHPTPEEECSLRGTVLDAYTRVAASDSAPSEHWPLKCLAPGKARAPLVGGNLSLLASALGTPYAIRTKGKIIFIEEIAEAPYRVDRLFTQLLHSDFFKDAVGVLFGSFTQCEPHRPEFKDTTIEQVLTYWGEKLGRTYGIPVLSGILAGHGEPQNTLAIGALAEISALNKKHCSLRYNSRLPR